MAEIIADGENGLHFSPDDAAELAEKVEWVWTHPAEMEAMGHAARAEYEAKYTAEQNHQMLIAIYERALCGTKEPTAQSTKVVSAQR
jgi:glycosyltransferase involved in cell wall biosynthesis